MIKHSHSTIYRALRYMPNVLRKPVVSQNGMMILSPFFNRTIL